MTKKRQSFGQVLREASGLTAEQLRILREQARQVKAQGKPGAEGGDA